CCRIERRLRCCQCFPNSYPKPSRLRNKGGGEFPSALERLWRKSFGIMESMNHAFSRRHLLASSGLGLGTIALATLLRDEGLLAADSKPPLDKPDLIKPTYDLKPKVPSHAPRAKAMISMFMQGGPSQMDLLDP